MNIALPGTGSGIRGNKELSAEGDIPSSYYRLSMEEIHRRGLIAKESLGDDLLVLCHHYQQDGTFWFGDVSGDSLFLAREAAKTSAKYIVFCGVHFMAESADILTSDEQVVILPDLTAGCSMADMANLSIVEKAWEKIIDICGEGNIIPITYINSDAALKAFCALNGGTVCTSSNSRKILKWALERNKRVLFFPDQHLGRNTANSLDVEKRQQALWNRELEDGGLSKREIEEARVILWNGYCSVHCLFTVEQIVATRELIPDVNVIVHPGMPRRNCGSS